MVCGYIALFLVNAVLIAFEHTLIVTIEHAMVFDQVLEVRRKTETLGGVGMGGDGGRMGGGPQWWKIALLSTPTYRWLPPYEVY